MFDTAGAKNVSAVTVNAQKRTSCAIDTSFEGWASVRGSTKLHLVGVDVRTTQPDIAIAETAAAWPVPSTPQ